MGVLGELKANDWLSLRLIPTMHFGDKKVVFKEQRSGKVVEQYVKSTYLSVPVDFKISAARFNNYRPYVVAGVAPTVDLTVKKGKELLVKRTDMMFEIGMGPTAMNHYSRNGMKTSGKYRTNRRPCSTTNPSEPNMYMKIPVALLDWNSFH